MDIKGIFCTIKDKNVFVDLPSHYGFEDGKKIKYPLISFCDAQKHRDLITQIRTGLYDFIIKEALESQKENVIVKTGTCLD